MKSYSTDDPDGPGLAMGSVRFTLEMHTTSGSLAVKEISVGYNYQSTKAMVPTDPGCVASATNPANITISPQFVAGGYTYTVNQCNLAVTTGGLQVFDRTATGLLDQGTLGAGITLTTAWVPAFTVTLWALTPVMPEGGYALLQSSFNSSPGPNSNYAVVDGEGNEVPTSSLSFDAPLALTSATLPVGLSKFDITCTGNGAKLNWQTVSEQNSKNFEIEKSTNGATNWITIGSTNAAGNSSLSKQYEYFDLKGGTAYYRLRQIDRDGRFTYSSVQNVTCKAQNSSILLYPVPAKNIVNLVLSTERSSKASIVLVDMSGKVMRQINTSLEKGMNNLKVNVAGLSSGEYILKVVGSDAFKTQKVTILN